MNRLALFFLVACFAGAAAAVHLASQGDADRAAQPAEGPGADPAPSPAKAEARARLPLPSTLSTPGYEAELFPFLESREYIKLGWKQDKAVRDTGPYIDGTYYGTHPAVRVFYSPEVIAWLEGGRKGVIPDGAMIIKEQYEEPAARHAGKSEAELRESLWSWTVMVKDAQGSHDGWFWSNPAAGQEVVDNHQTISHPVSGFGLYCIRCHASTRSPGAEAMSPENEFTFASLRNIQGYPGEPLLFRVDNSWRNAEPEYEIDLSIEGALADTSLHAPSGGAHPVCTDSGGVTPCSDVVNQQFVAFYNGVATVAREDCADLPPVTHDWVASRRGMPERFITSNQCMSCHAGLLKPFGPTMFITTGESADYGDPGWDISPYGEWRWTPMGLAGRDPIFLAQLESERRLLAKQFASDPSKAKRLGDVLEDTCLKCHGVMGRTQFHAENPSPTALFTLDKCDKTCAEDQPMGRGEAGHAALARDGISCMVCHRMQRRPQPAGDDRPYLQHFLETSVTGNLYFGPPDELYGPYEDDDVAQYPMQHALGVTPKKNAFLQSSQMCGSCHTVTLPAVNKPIEPHEHDELNEAQVVEEFTAFQHHVEQATYLEWLNSEYENEFNPQNPRAKSCQDCHMSRGFVDRESGLEIDALATQAAVIQDHTYPEGENLAEHKDLHVKHREEGYSRHNFSGLNLFLIELFDQFADVLGVRTQDYMTGSAQAVEQARRNFLLTAREKTAEIDLAVSVQGDQLLADVTVRNKTGHRFPSGVAFRRAFLELAVLQPGEDGPEQVLWRSGGTNSLGVIVGADGEPLPTEFYSERESGGQHYQRHHQEITREDQVQIYEALTCDDVGRFTTSFLGICENRKDNRLLPRGWTAEGPGPALTGKYLEATHPHGLAKDDPRYADGSGADEVRYRITLPEGADPELLKVRVTLYYQAIPPYFLRNLFRTAPDQPATQRLHFMLSRVDFEGTAVEDWKLPIVSATGRVAH